MYSTRAQSRASINVDNLPPSSLAQTTTRELDEVVLTEIRSTRTPTGHMRRRYQCTGDELPNELVSLSSDSAVTLDDPQGNKLWKCFVIDGSDLEPAVNVDGGRRDCHAELVKPHSTDMNSLVDVHEMENVQITSDLFSYQRQAEVTGDKNTKEITLSIQTNDGRDVCTDTRGWWDPNHLVLYHIDRPALPIRYEVEYSDITPTGRPGEVSLKSVNVITMDNKDEEDSIQVLGGASAIEAQGQSEASGSGQLPSAAEVKDEQGSTSNVLHSSRRRQSSRLAGETIDFDDIELPGLEHRELRWLTRNVQHQGHY